MNDARIRFEPSPRWVRVQFGGITIADSEHMMLLTEDSRIPVYYFPREDVREEYLEPSDVRMQDPRKGETLYWSVRVGDRVARDAACAVDRPAAESQALRGYVAFQWNMMDHWYEEDDEVFVHARDPYKRVDTLHSSRHVRITVDGEMIAESRRPILLFETGLPTRYYLPPRDVRTDVLVPSDTVTQCPYKGIAKYWSIRLGEREFKDMAWSYPFPLPEIPKIEGLIAFYNERVDALVVDGEERERLRNRWSRE